MSTPCRDCEERTVGCHAVCEKYIAWRKAIDDRREAERPGVLQDYDRERISRALKKEERNKKLKMTKVRRRT